MTKTGWHRLRVAATVVLAVVALLTAGQVWLHDHAARSTQTALVTQRGKLAGSVDSLRAQVTFCAQHPRNAYCKQPAAPPPAQTIAAVPVKPVPLIGAAGAPGPAGPTGPSPTEAQIEAAVAAYMIAHPSPPSPPPSAAQLNAAVAAYMASHPVQPGQQGAAGAPGPAGPQGPAGPAGEDGSPGPSGATGNGVASMRYTDQCHVTVTYTDGTSQDITIGNCPPPLVTTPGT